MTTLIAVLPLYAYLLFYVAREVVRKRRWRAEDAAYEARCAARVMPEKASVQFKPIAVYVNGQRVSMATGFRMSVRRGVSGDLDSVLVLSVLVPSQPMDVDLLALTVSGAPVVLTMTVEGVQRRHDGKFVGVEMTTDWKTGASLAEYTFKGAPEAAGMASAPADDMAPATDDGTPAHYVDGGIAVGSDATTGQPAAVAYTDSGK